METRIKLVDVIGHYEDDRTKTQRIKTFGVTPLGWDVSNSEDFPHDDMVYYWLETDEPLNVGGVYGDFVVTSVEGGE